MKVGEFVRVSSFVLDNVVVHFNTIPPEGQIADIIVELERREGEGGIPYYVKLGDKYYSKDDLHRCQNFYLMKNVRYKIAEEENWYHKVLGGVEQPAGTPLVDFSVIHHLISMIHERPGEHQWPNAQLKVDDLKRLVGSRWINDAIMGRIADLLNIKCKDTYAVYLNFEPDLHHLAGKIKDKFEGLPRKLVITLNVGIDGPKTYLGDSYDEKGSTKGSHFSFGVYLRDSNVLHYGDSLGWPASAPKVYRHRA